MKLKWKVAKQETGRWGYKRCWPSAEYDNDDICAEILCSDEYIPTDVKIGKHAELKLRIADHSVKPWKWRTAIKRPATLKEAKELLKTILKKNPKFMPS